MTPQAAKPRILVVDDNLANRAAFETLLEPDYTVRLAAGGHQALELSLREEFALILLDVRMPGMDGFETAASLRARERTREIPIIFLSAYDLTFEQIKRAYVAGATDFIPSPVDEDLLRFKAQAFVHLYLRNERTRTELHHLQALIQGLEAQANSRRNFLEPGLRMKIEELGAAIGGLERHFLTTSP